MNNRYYARRRSRRKTSPRFFIVLGVLIVALAGGIYLIVTALNNKPGNPLSPSETAEMSAPDGSVTLPTATPTIEPTPTPAPTMAAELVPHATENTDPAKFGFATKVYVDGVETPEYNRGEAVMFPTGAEYTALQGVTTYRGNNYRDASSYGTADIATGKLTLLDIDKTTSAIGRWSGSACTGQPLVVTWPDKTRANMTSLFEEFRNKAGFTEVIIASADGNIYFMELSTGTKTREPISIGSPTKGTASLDPRGYPIIYVGQGLNPTGSVTECNDMYFRIYSLIDGTELYNFGASQKDPQAYRNWQAYDASPLIDAATDTLIEPGENGVLYTVKLNTVYDETAGTVSMTPGAMVKYVYDSTRNASSSIYGMENSPTIWRNYVFFTDNIGMLQCVDLNTMKLIYANDLDNDSDVSMVLEEDIEKQAFYLYTGSEFDDTVVNAKEAKGSCYARKIDGLTGEILWTKDFSVFTEVDGSVDGGILATPILGKAGTSIDGLIIYTISNAILEDGTKTALMVALNKQTGEVVWQLDLENSGWTPSSPVPVYTADGQTYIVQCLYKGDIKLIKADAVTGTIADTLSMGTEDEPNSFEATPVVFGNTIVVGSRNAHFFFLTIG
jgi:outer membrane protein assembly factor BamB